jgi:hypothetical protein
MYSGWCYNSGVQGAMHETDKETNDEEQAYDDDDDDDDGQRRHKMKDRQASKRWTKKQ